MATIKKPSASVVSNIPCRCGQTAATKVTDMIAMAGSVTPTNPRQKPISVAARTAMMAIAMPAEMTTAWPKGMYS